MSPTALRSTAIRGDSVTLAWEPPSVQSIKDIRSYIIEKLDRNMEWSRVATLPPTSTRYTVPDLEEGSQYRFRILTETPSGISKALEY